MLKPDSCERFRRLSSEALDRELKPSEQEFINSHVVACDRCAELRFSSLQSLAALRGLSLDALPSEGFTNRLMRRYEIRSLRESARFWTPALIGAAIAGIAFLAAFQAISKPASLRTFSPQASEARRMQATPKFWDIDAQDSTSEE